MKKIILPLLVFIVCTSVSAQTVATRNSLPMSFEDALDITMSGNPQIAALEYEEKAAEHERKAAFGLRLPQIGIVGTYAHMGDNVALDLNHVRDGLGGVLSGMAGELNVSQGVLDAANAVFKKNWELKLLDKDLAIIGATVKMPIYTGGKINAANRAAKINEKNAGYKGDQAKAMLVSELVERYYGLLLAYNAIIVREQVVDAMKVHLSDAQALEENGVIARSERIYVEVKLAEAERDLLDARSNAVTISRALNNTLSLDGRNVMPVSSMFVLRNIPSLYNFKELAAENNPQLKQVEMTKELAEQKMRAIRADFAPQVAALGGANIYNHNVPDFMPNWFVGVGVQFKIFDGLNREQKFKAAKNTVKQVESLQDKAKDDIDLLIEKLYNELLNCSDRMPSIEKTMEFATEYLRVKSAGFKEGISTSVDVIDAELNLAKTRIERLQTAYNYDLALAKLLEAAGVSENFLSYAKGTSAVPVMFE